MPERMKHKDELSEQHFTELRTFLVKKHRQEAIQNKMSRAGRNFANRGAKTSMNDDISPKRGGSIDREIMLESPMDQDSPLNMMRKRSVGGQPI